MLFLHLLEKGFMFQKTSSCFTSQMFYIRNILISSYIINKTTFIITTIIIIIIIMIIIIVFNLNITFIIIIIISRLSLNPPSSSSSFSVSFYISLTSEVRVFPSYLNSSVFFNYLFFIIYWL